MSGYQQLPTSEYLVTDSRTAWRRWKIITAASFCSILAILATVHIATGSHEKYPSTELACLKRGHLKNEGRINFPDYEDETGKFEPSGAVWGEKSASLWVVSDNSRVAEFGADGTLKNHWKITPKWDLEGVAMDQEDPQYLYIAVESPPVILKYDTVSATVITEYSLEIPDNAARPENKGIEAITFLPGNYRTALKHLTKSQVTESKNGYFLVGVQATADVYIYHNPPQGAPIANFKWPAPKRAGKGRADLAEMTLYDGHLYASFDRYKTLSRVNLIMDDDKDGEGPDPTPEWQFFKVQRRGIEAMAFAEVKTPRDGGNEQEVRKYLFVGFDWKKRRGMKRYSC